MAGKEREIPSQIDLPQMPDLKPRKIIGGILFGFLLAKGVEIEGQENLPEPPFIVAVNHMAWAEGPVLYFFLPKPAPHLMIKSETFNLPVIGQIIKSMHSIPIRRGESDVSAFRASLKVLEKGEPIVIFPEGTRGRNKERLGLKPPTEGIIFLAKKANVPIVPMAVWGTENILSLIEEEGFSLPEVWSLIKPGSQKKEQIHVRIGPPFLEHLNLPDKGPLDNGLMAAYAQGLMFCLRDLLPPAYHGCYAEKSSNIL